MNKTQIGVIESVSFGKGGYQDCMLGLSLTFTFKGSGVGTFINGGWAIERSNHAKWTESDRAKQQADMCAKIIVTLNHAKVDCITKLKGKPVECTFEGNELKDWRILVEGIL